jgi:hypothetical protein
VYSPSSDRCIGIEKIQASKKLQLIASLTSREKLCGVHESPWLINVEPGQKIDLSLIDFAWTNVSSKPNICPINYGYILDMKTDDVIKICGGLERNTFLYTSSGDSVQIVLEASNIQDNSFLIQFKGKIILSIIFVYATVKFKNMIHDTKLFNFIQQQLAAQNTKGQNIRGFSMIMGH